ncbi:MAG: hypothetical protein H6685_09415 [Deltaproteobacteria bacterium]|nr:hypothetical protein [Deltaproteobacteria bacterium]
MSTSAQADESILIDAATLHQKVVVEKALDWVVVDARDKVFYLAGHIPGAVNLPWRATKAKQDGVWAAVINDPSKLAKMLGDAGIARSDTVVVYGDPDLWGEEGRAFWLFEYIDHPRVRVLDGGIKAWTAAGYGTKMLPAKARAKTYGEITFDRDKVVDSATLAKYARSSGWVVVDARSPEEYAGSIKYGEERGGHVPGALPMHFTSLYADDGTFLRGDHLLDTLKSAGIPTSDNARQNAIVTAYCTGGVRSGVTYLALRLAGYAHPRNHDESMFVYARNVALPLDAGDGYALVGDAMPKRLAAGNAKITQIDTRTDAAFKLRHAEGARSLPVNEDDDENDIAARLAEVAPDKDAPLVIYGIDAKDDGARLVAKVAALSGYSNVNLVVSGFAAVR